MIGIIGPTDSVSLAMLVATEGGFADEIVPRWYEHADEATAIARELDSSCHVVLFTGQVPYMLTSNSDLVQAELQFISHSGADLYRCIARVLIDRQGVMPRASIDSIEESIVMSTFAEMELPAPTAHPLGSPEDDVVVEDIGEVVAFHRASLASGRAEVVLTCLAEVYAVLKAEGVAVWRIEHTTVTVTEALQKARLSDQLIRSRSEQLALAVFQIDGSALRKLDVYEREVARLHVHRELLDMARKNGGRLTALEGGAFSIATSRGTVESAIERQKAGQASLLNSLALDVDVRAGIGIGSTFSQAESNAKQALGLAKAHSDTHVVFPDGRVHSGDVEGGAGYLQLQDNSRAFLDLAHRLGIGALSTRRLIDALGRIGHDAITAQQLADAYGVQARSARRLLTALAKEGLAADVGVWSKPGAGRPQALFKVDVKALIASATDGGGANEAAVVASEGAESLVAAGDIAEGSVDRSAGSAGLN